MTMKTLTPWHKLGKSLLNLVYPLECRVCKRGLNPYVTVPLCQECKAALRMNLPPFCLKCGKSLPIAGGNQCTCHECRYASYAFERNWAATQYEGVIKECIHALKFNGYINLVPFISELLLNFARLHSNLAAFDLIIPVPLHPTRQRERTFNQAELIAKGFSQDAKVPMDADVLAKTKHTPPQTQLSKEQRQYSSNGAFSVTDPSLVHHRKILLIDDVFTTGSTLNACARALRENGAQGVWCLVVARGR
jgi:ComF family protein